MKKIYEYSPVAIRRFAIILIVLSLFLILFDFAAMTVSILLGLIGFVLSGLFLAVSFQWFKIAREKQAGIFDLEKYTKKHTATAKKLNNNENVNSNKVAIYPSKLADAANQNAKPRLVITHYNTSNEYPNSFVAFDLETTGLNAGTDEILQIGAIKYDSGVETQRFMMYSKPTKPIPKEVSKINGIYANTVTDAPGIKTVLEKFIEFIKDYTLIAHNASFDMGFLQTFLNSNDMQAINNDVIDTLYLSRIHLNLPNYKLQTIKQHYGIDVASHEALSDCTVCATLYLDYLNYINPQYDDITDEAYKCFIDDAGDPISDNMRAILDKKCKDNNGKCYRTPAKSAKFAVIVSDLYKNADRVEHWRKIGYKVTTLDELLKYWGLS